MKTLFVLILCLAACSAKKSKDTPAPEPSFLPAANSTTAPADATPGQVFRSPLATRVRSDRHGTNAEWTSLAGISVANESYKSLYESGGSHFVAFKASIKVEDQNCLVDWRADLIATGTGRGPNLGTISGMQALKANTETIVSGVLALSSEDLARLGSASAGYWSICGEALPQPSAHDFEITTTTSEQIKFGNSFDIHHTVLGIRGLGKEPALPTRCFFDIVAEDRDAEGYTLNRDFASYSLGPAESGIAKLRRTSFEGGHEKDYADAAVGKQSYLRDVYCEGAWQADTSKIQGIEIRDLKLRPHVGEPSSAEHFVRATFGHQGRFRNTVGRDCSFRVRYRMLDKSGVPMNKAPILSETLHLLKAGTFAYQSKDERLYVWKDQVEKVGSLVVENATPIDGCKGFDPTLALGVKTN